MGEYISYKGQEIKIGTMANLYYVTFPKYLKAFCTGALNGLPDNGSPVSYLQPDSQNYFRFPFPDEDKLAFGEIKDDNLRSIPITVDAQLLPDFGIESSKVSAISIVQQQLVQNQNGELMLAVVYRDHEKGNFFRIDEEDLAQKLIRQIVRNHILPAPDIEQKVFYRKIALRILMGYKLEENIKMQLDAALKKNPNNNRRGLRN